MKRNIYVKLPLKAISTKSHEPKRLINVCAWCPKESYPELEENEDYTHGLCEKHYLILRDRKLPSK